MPLIFYKLARVFLKFDLDETMLYYVNILQRNIFFMERKKEAYYFSGFVLFITQTPFMTVAVSLIIRDIIGHKLAYYMAC